jgi:hypothetical protein
MWKMIIGQAIYQLIVTLILNFEGQHIFPKWDNGHMQTVVFNTFVFMQIFNQYKQVTGFPTGPFIQSFIGRSRRIQSSSPSAVVGFSRCSLRSELKGLLPVRAFTTPKFYVHKSASQYVSGDPVGNPMDLG